MSSAAHYYDTVYGTSANRVMLEIRQQVYGEQDIGQNSWLTRDEYRLYGEWLGLSSGSSILELASGSGGPALFLAHTFGCQVFGIDINPQAIAAAQARQKGRARVSFHQGDAGAQLPFDDNSFDAVVCIDSINHLPERLQVLREWARVLKPGTRLLFTDPILVTASLSNKEIAIRSSIGYMLFTPLGENERLLRAAGLELLQSNDVTENVANISRKRHEIRAQFADSLREIEGAEQFNAFQEFLSVTHTLSSERRLSRYVFLAAKPAHVG